jgi:hypothetical protein
LLTGAYGKVHALSLVAASFSLRRQSALGAQFRRCSTGRGFRVALCLAKFTSIREFGAVVA